MAARARATDFAATGGKDWDVGRMAKQRVVRVA